MRILQHLTLLPGILRLYKNPWMYYLDKLNFFGDRALLTAKLRGGITLKIHSGNSDINSITEIFLSDVYRKMLAKISPSSVFVDLGANIGVVTIAAARRLTNGKVFAFEPNPQVFPLLDENIALNNLKERVAAYSFCIAGEKGARTMYFEPLKWGGGRILPHATRDGAATKFEVDCITLEDVVSLAAADSIDFLKIDCEGAEGEILRAAPDHIFKRIRNILVEYHEPYASADEIKNILETHNFTVIAGKDLHAFYASNRSVN